MHNDGIAVDVTNVDGNGKEIDMGFTPFYKSNLSICWGYAKLKLFGLNYAQKNGRHILSDVMKKAGFLPLSYEWRNSNGMRRIKPEKSTR